MTPTTSGAITGLLVMTAMADSVEDASTFIAAMYADLTEINGQGGLQLDDIVAPAVVLARALVDRLRLYETDEQIGGLLRTFALFEANGRTKWQENPDG